MAIASNCNAGTKRIAFDVQHVKASKYREKHVAARCG